MVVIFFPSCIMARVMQDKILFPSACTVQAPHCPQSQPFFVPVKCNCSLRRSSKLTRGSTVREYCLPLISNCKETCSKNLAAFSSSRESAAFTKTGLATASVAIQEDCFKNLRLDSLKGPGPLAELVLSCGIKQ